MQIEPCPEVPTHGNQIARVIGYSSFLKTTNNMLLFKVSTPTHLLLFASNKLSEFSKNINPVTVDKDMIRIGNSVCLVVNLLKNWTALGSTFRRTIGYKSMLNNRTESHKS